MSASIEAASNFLLPISQLHRNESFLRKAVLPRHATSMLLNPSFSLVLDFSFSLLALACWLALLLLCQRQLALHCPSSMASTEARYGLPFGVALARAHQGIALGVYKFGRLNSAATRALGVLGGINCRQCLARSVALACPRRSLEGLLFVTQKTCLRKSQRFFVSNKCLIALVPYVYLGTTTGQPCHFTIRKIKQLP